MTTKPSEILVLGAGMIGVCSALALQARGHAVTLIDRQPPGRETSYGNAGIIQREAVQPYAFPRDWATLWRVARGGGNDVHYHLNALPGLAPRLLRYWSNSAPEAYAKVVEAWSRLIAHCLTEHAVWIARAGAEELVTRRGWMQIFRTEALREAATRKAQALADAHGLACTMLDGEALARAQPALRRRLAGAIHWGDPWTISEPGELVARYARLFEQLGGRFVHGDAQSLQPTGSGWSVQSLDEAGRRVEAEQAVIALGPWSEQATRALGYRLPLFVKRGYHRHYRGGASLPLPMLDVEVGVMLAPMQQGIRLTTGAEFARQDAPASPHQLRQAESACRELIDLGEGVEPAPWLGARPCTADMLPVIGPAPRHPGLWFHFGHGHQGFTLGPVSARLLAELIDGEEPLVDPQPYSPARF